MALIEVENLSVEFDTRQGHLEVLREVNFSLDAGEALGIVGESGCGKSLTSLALMGLLPPNAQVRARSLQFNGENLLTMTENRWRNLRGGKMAMVFQDPMTSLNPSFTIGFQLMEVLAAHGCQTKDLKAESVKLLDHVGIPDASRRLSAYPHEFSGGMCQRVMIAMAIACRPLLLIADEPTTALDVTIQAQILDLLGDLRREYKMALLLISHDFGVIAENVDRVQIMYAGEIVEAGPVRQVIDHPWHPYTAGLLASLPGKQSQCGSKSRLMSISGLVPDLLNRPAGCQFHLRCAWVRDDCKRATPSLEVTQSRGVRCLYPLKESGASK